MNIRQKIGFNIVKATFARLAVAFLWPVLVGSGILVALLCVGLLLLMPEKAVAQKTPIVDLHLSIKNVERNNTYRPFAWPKLVGYGLAGFGGLKDGMVEGYEFDGRKSWERKRGVSPYSQRGSQSWRSVYVEGNPDLGFKSKFHEVIGSWDWYHRNDDYRKIGYIGGGFAIGISGAKVNGKWWHYALDALIGYSISATTKSLGMKHIRN